MSQVYRYQVLWNAVFGRGVSEELRGRLIMLKVRIQKLKYIASHPVVAFRSVLK
jgi:hypothetical protein